MFGMNFRRQRQMVTEWHRPGGDYYTISGKVLTAEHTLIAGATGCGKSTFLRSVLQAFLTKYSPATGKLVLIDPKEDFRPYKNLPHTIAYASESEDAVAALEMVVAEMKTRYSAMGDSDEEDWSGSQMFVVIEELADLLCSPEKTEIKLLIQRLTQKGRAAGIHVIACTQSPSRKTIPAEITLNFTARIGLSCETPIESKQIVGMPGCEMLPDHGVAIYKYKRSVLQVKLPYVTKADIRPLIDYWMSDECKTVRFA